MLHLYNFVFFVEFKSAVLFVSFLENCCIIFGIALESVWLNLYTTIWIKTKLHLSLHCSDLQFDLSSLLPLNNYLVIHSIPCHLSKKLYYFEISACTTHSSIPLQPCNFKQWQWATIQVIWTDLAFGFLFV
jgi:hypothetical protein